MTEHIRFNEKSEKILAEHGIEWQKVRGFTEEETLESKYFYVDMNKYYRVQPMSIVSLREITSILCEAYYIGTTPFIPPHSKEMAWECTNAAGLELSMDRDKLQAEIKAIQAYEKE